MTKRIDTCAGYVCTFKYKTHVLEWVRWGEKGLKHMCDAGGDDDDVSGNVFLLLLSACAMTKRVRVWRGWKRYIRLPVVLFMAT